MGSSSLAATMVWCRVLAFLAIVTFVFSSQSVDSKNGAIDTMDNSLDLDLNHILTKRDVKDPEKKIKKKNKRERKKGNVRNKRLEKKQKKMKKKKKQNIKIKKRKNLKKKKKNQNSQLKK